MSTMKSVLTLRLPEEDIKAIAEIALREKTDKSTAVRELVELGKVYFAILKYKDGKISLGKAAELAGIPLVEMMDTLATLGIESKLEIQDYLDGIKAAEGIMR